MNKLSRKRRVRIQIRKLGSTATSLDRRKAIKAAASVYKQEQRDAISDTA